MGPLHFRQRVSNKVLELHQNLTKAESSLAVHIRTEKIGRAAVAQRFCTPLKYRDLNPLRAAVTEAVRTLNTSSCSVINMIKAERTCVTPPALQTIDTSLSPERV